MNVQCLISPTLRYLQSTVSCTTGMLDLVFGPSRRALTVVGSALWKDKGQGLVPGQPGRTTGGQIVPSGRKKIEERNPRECHSR